MTSSNLSWVELFKAGRWKACSHAIRQILKESSMAENEEDTQCHARRIALTNNLFVCDQLSMDWDSSTEKTFSQEWVKSFCEIMEVYHLLRCQHVCSKLPLDLILCVTYNAMWWGVMKVDPLHQHSCEKETLGAAIYALKIVSDLFGSWSPQRHSNGSIVTDFIDAVHSSISCLVKLTPIQCQLTIEIISLGNLICLDTFENSSKKIGVDYQKTMDDLIDTLPQLKAHFTYEQTDAVSKPEFLVKFGWKEIGELLSETSIATISEALLISTAIFLLRDSSTKLKKNGLESLKYLNLIDKSSLMFPFIFHYLNALAHCNTGNFDSSLYHLQHACTCSSNFFMQGRSYTLKGQVLLLQNKGAKALQVLQSVQYKRKEVQLPMCPFLIGKAYEKLGKIKQQIEVWDLLLDCLSGEHAVQPKLCSPVAGMEHRLLLTAHFQPEISYEEVLQSSAMANLSAQQPKEAAEKLLQLVHIRSMVMDEDIESDKTLWKLSELLHDTASALLRAHCLPDAEQICEAALQFHRNKVGLDNSTASHFSSLQEDVIALILLAEVKDSQGSSDVSGILNRCAKLLQILVERVSTLAGSNKETAVLAKALLARIFLHKALSNARRKFEEDAIACFQRALSCNEDDPEIIVQFAQQLLDMNQHDESLALWKMFKDRKELFRKDDSIALNYLLGDKMSLDTKEEILRRLESL